MRIQLRSGILAVLAQAQPFSTPYDGPGSSPDGAFVCPNGGVTLLDQGPTGAGGFFSDSDCDLCGGAQVLAENFTVAAETNVSQIVFWGGYFPGNLVPGVPAPFNVIFHQDVGGIPGGVVDAQLVSPTSHTATGVISAGVDQIEVVLDFATVTLPAGNYLVEVFADTLGSPDSWFWEVGNFDPVNGAPGFAFAFEAPGAAWNFTGPGIETALAVCEGEGGVPEHARFFVTKDFDDNNESEVDVTLSCNTGLPLEQPATISEGDPVNFVVGDFEQGALNCEVTEVTIDGYTASYNDGDGISADNCSWEDLTGGQYRCVITNSLDESEVE
jgi:hypothetical protein